MTRRCAGEQRKRRTSANRHADNAVLREVRIAATTVDKMKYDLTIRQEFSSRSACVIGIRLVLIEEIVPIVRAVGRGAIDVVVRPIVSGWRRDYDICRSSWCEACYGET